MITDIILGLAVILLSGLLVSKLCKKLHIPSVTGYLIVGLLLSPGLFGLIPIGNGNFFPGILNESLVIGSKAIDMNTLQEVSVSASLSVISEIELGFIAFSIGVEFKKDYVKQLGKKPIILAFSESGFAMILIFAACMIFYPLVNVIMGEGGFDIVQYVCLSLALGAIGSATAPAATMMVIKQYKAKGPVTNNLIAVVAVDDASALIFFGIAISVIQVVSANTGGSSLNGGQLTLICLLPIIEILFSLGLGGFLGYILSLACRWFKGRGTRLSCTITAILLGVGLSNLINTLINENESSAWVNMNVSSLFTVMILALFFTNLSKEEEQVNDLVERFNPPLTIIFFVLSGASVDFRLFKSEGGVQLLGIALLLIACYVISRSFGKFIGTFIGGKLLKMDKNVTNLLSLGLMPQGGVALGLAIMVGKLGTFTDSIGGSSMNMATIIKLTIVVSCFITELFGPSFTKYMLFKANEADPALK